MLFYMTSKLCLRAFIIANLSCDDLISVIMINVITSLCVYFFFLVVPHHAGDLNSLTWDQTRVPCNGGVEF